VEQRKEGDDGRNGGMKEGRKEMTEGRKEGWKEVR
jgi:hypothetical protein